MAALSSITGIAQGWLRAAVSDPREDWLRHLAGLPCQREVTTHEFVSGRTIGYRASRCAWLPAVTADWCRIPRRCHPLVPGREAQDQETASA